jgi:hypothetical protein
VIGGERIKILGNRVLNTFHCADEKAGLMKKIIYRNKFRL